MLNVKSIKVKSGKVIGEAFVLCGEYKTDDGRTINSAEHLSVEERRTLLNLYPVSEFIPAYDYEYQQLANPTYTIVGDIVELRHSVENNVAIYPQLVQLRLDSWAKQKVNDQDFDGINDATSYKDSTNLEWQAQAIKAILERDTTWQAYYNLIKTTVDWREIEAQLPVLSW